MNKLHITNSNSREKEIFIPINPPYVGMYVCGPTVSGESHLGHARPYVTFDLVFRYLQHLGYKVRYVRNITDAGHFEEEGRKAEDKVSGKAKLEKLEPMELVQKYTNLYHDAMDKLNCLRPSIEPTATGHIPEQIEMIEHIIQKGLAYVSNGSVYFDVAKYAAGNEYGKLSGRKIEDMMAGSRELDGQDEKRNAIDFALWKNAAPEHIMRWRSPWGEGFPGWHIECSAMATKYLGEQFDIHGGGMDLQFPHHESEIAQSHTCSGVQPVKYWMHNNMITVNGKKMGKSYNNTITLRELFSGNHPLLEQAYSPMTVRFLILQSHYRSTLDFSNEALQAAEKGLQRLMKANALLKKLSHTIENAGDEKINTEIENSLNEAFNNLSDDFNTAITMAELFNLSGIINSLFAGQLDVKKIGTQTFQRLQNDFRLLIEDILGLQNEEAIDDAAMDGLVNLFIEMRADAKLKKDFAASDNIRNKLQVLGIKLKDNKDGTTGWERE